MSRAHWEMPSGDPRDRTPNENPLPAPPPGIPPGGQVGPQSDPGEVMSWSWPAHAEAWAGWPDGWQTPFMEPSPTWSTFFGYGAQDPGGYLRRVSTVMTCVDLNSRQIAAFPAYGVRNREPLDLPTWYSRGPEPTKYSGWVAFMKAAANSYQLFGFALLWAVARFADGYPSRFVVLPPQRVELDDDETVWLTDGEGGRMKLADQDLCWINYEQDPLSKRGIGPLQWVGRNLVSAAALETYSSNIARYGVSALLKHPGRLTARQSEDLKSYWMAARAAMPTAPAVLSGGIEYEQLSLSPKDMALLDLKIFDMQMIAAAFGVPSFLVGLPQSGQMVYSNASTLGDFHWRQTLRPMAQSFSDAMSQWLLPAGTTIEFNPDRYVQGDFGERAQAYATMVGIGAMSNDEVRMAERFTPDAEPSPPVPPPVNAVDGMVGSIRG